MTSIADQLENYEGDPYRSAEETVDGINLQYLGESLGWMRVCADSEDGHAVASAAESIWPCDAFAGWRYEPDGPAVPDVTVPCEDHEGRFHHVLYC